VRNRACRLAGRGDDDARCDDDDARCADGRRNGRIPGDATVEAISCASL